jgi:hypothetical protein
MFQSIIYHTEFIFLNHLLYAKILSTIYKLFNIATNFPSKIFIYPNNQKLQTKF